MPTEANARGTVWRFRFLYPGRQQRATVKNAYRVCNCPRRGLFLCPSYTLPRQMLRSSDGCGAAGQKGKSTGRWGRAPGGVEKPRLPVEQSQKLPDVVGETVGNGQKTAHMYAIVYLLGLFAWELRGRWGVAVLFPIWHYEAGEAAWRSGKNFRKNWGRGLTLGEDCGKVFL